MNKTVAIFDDDESICRAVGKLVSKKGFVAVTAHTIPEAAFTIGKSAPDIVIADFEFHCGLNISMLAKSLRNTAEKVIILTSRDPREILDKYPQLSFAKFIKKGESLKNVMEQIA